MANTPLESFLISLGFKVDANSQRKFDEGMERAKELFINISKKAAIAGTAVGVAIDRMGRKLDELYFASKRTGASATNIRAFGYAVSQLGGDAANAQNSLEAVARMLRNAPGSEGILKNVLATVGASTRDANGNLRDMAEIFKDMGRALQVMPPERANAFAEALGIDERTLQAMRSGEISKYMEEHQRLMKQMGFDADEAARAGREYAQAMREMAASAEVLGMKMQKHVLPIVREAIEAMREFSKLMDSPGKLIEQTKVVKDKGPLTNGPGFLDKLLPRSIVDWLNPGVRWPDQSVSGKIVDEQGRPLGAGGSKAPASAQDSALRFFQSMGWTPAQAAGIVANLMHESKLQPGAVGDGGKAFGIAQWHPDRQAAFKAWSGKEIQQSSFQEQLAFVHHELSKGAEQRAGALLRAAENSRQAAEIVSRYYERPLRGDAEAAARGATAAQLTATTTIHVHGSADPYATGQAVADQQKRVAQDAIRNFAPLVR